MFIVFSLGSSPCIRYKHSKPSPKCHSILCFFSFSIFYALSLSLSCLIFPVSLLSCYKLSRFCRTDVEERQDGLCKRKTIAIYYIALWEISRSTSFFWSSKLYDGVQKPSCCFFFLKKLYYSPKIKLIIFIEEILLKPAFVNFDHPQIPVVYRILLLVSLSNYSNNPIRDGLSRAWLFKDGEEILESSWNMCSFKNS